jgi:hypothetical protein
MTDLRTMLMELADFGQPRLSQQDDGCWYACVKFPAPKGTRAEVASDFEHKTPEEALQCVHDRLGGLRDMLAVPSPQIGANHAEVNQ